MATFKHSGDLGDIVYALPAIRALGGGVLYLDTAGGADEPIRLAKKIVVCRSPRYQTNYPWFVVRKFTLRDKAVFVGLPKEHEIFEPRFPTTHFEGRRNITYV